MISLIEQATNIKIYATNKLESINLAHIDELRCMMYPPLVATEILKAIMIMLDEEDLSWVNQKKVLRRNNFIKSLLQIDFNEELCETKLEKVYPILYENDINPILVYSSSLAIGCLYDWIISYFKFQMILKELLEIQKKLPLGV